MQQLAKYGLILAGICLGRLFPAAAQDQPTTVKNDTTKVIHIIQSDKLNVVTKDSVSLNRFIGNAIFRQANTLFYCDSALINRASNILDAYGHIHINQNDSVHIYGDYLHYEGDTKLATLRDNARLTDGKITLSGPELQYDMNAKIGTYEHGGKLVNGSSVLTSQEGFYYADTKDVYFKQNVLLVDPEYTLTTDTLLYNTITKIATLVAPTTINDGKTIMYATSGEYNTEVGQGNFDSRPTIEDSTATITADRIIMDKKTGLAHAYGNMVYKDTAQKMTLISNYGKVDQIKKTILATQHPLMIMEGEKDTLYLAADTLFSGILKRDSLIPGPAELPVVKVSKSAMEAVKKPLKPGVIGAKIEIDSIKTDSIPVVNSVKVVDSVHVDSVIAVVDTLKKPATIGFKDKLVKAAGIADDKERDSVMNAADTATLATFNPSLSKEIRDSLVMAGPNPDLVPDTATTKDTTEIRYLMAWNHVRIYSDSLQGVADSVFYSTKDSIFRFYRNPILWANNTQLSGDSIQLITKNKTADKIFLDQNALIVKEVGKQMYNQIKGNQITGYFKEQSLDWMHVDGNAESIYYIQDDDGAFISVNKTLSGVINMYFLDGQLHHINFIKDPEGTMYPFTQRPKDQLLFENFHWDIQRRPKSKYELMGTSGEAIERQQTDTTTIKNQLP